MTVCQLLNFNFNKSVYFKKYLKSLTLEIWFTALKYGHFNAEKIKIFRCILLINGPLQYTDRLEIIR